MDQLAYFKWQCRLSVKYFFLIQSVSTCVVLYLLTQLQKKYSQFRRGYTFNPTHALPWKWRNYFFFSHVRNAQNFSGSPVLCSANNFGGSLGWVGPPPKFFAFSSGVKSCFNCFIFIFNHKGYKRLKSSWYCLINENFTIT